MRHATPADLPHLVDLLSDAFRLDPHIDWFIGSPRRSRAAITRRRALMRYIAVGAISIGEAWLTDSGQAAALWLRHDAKPHGFRFMAANAGFLFMCGWTATRRSLRAEKELTCRLPLGPYRFLWTVGVAETARGTGQLRELFEPVLAEADRANVPVYLETAVPRNISIYRHYGFEPDYTYRVDNGLAIAFMHRSSNLISALCERIS